MSLSFCQDSKYVHSKYILKKDIFDCIELISDDRYSDEAILIYWRNIPNSNYKPVNVIAYNIFDWSLFNKFSKVFNSIEKLNKVDIMPEDVLKILKDLQIKDATRYV